MTDVKVAVLLARLANLLEGIRLEAGEVTDDAWVGRASIGRAQQLVEQIRSEI